MRFPYSLSKWLFAFCFFSYLFAQNKLIQTNSEQVDYTFYSQCTKIYHTNPHPYQEKVFQETCLYPPAMLVLFKGIFYPPHAIKKKRWKQILSFSTTLCLLLPFFLLPWGRYTGRQKQALFLIAPLLLADPFTDSVSKGNMSALIVAMMLLSLVLVVRGAEANKWLAGILLGVAASIKLFPIYLAAYFLFAGWWRKQSKMRDSGWTAFLCFFAIQWFVWSPEYWSFVLHPKGLTRSLAFLGSNTSFLSFLNLLGWKVSPLVLLCLFGLPLGLYLLMKKHPIPVEASSVMLLVWLSTPAMWPHSYLIAWLPLVLSFAILIATKTDPSEEGKARQKLHRLLFLFVCLVFWQPEYFGATKQSLSLTGQLLAGLIAPLLLGYLLLFASREQQG